MVFWRKLLIKPGQIMNRANSKWLQCVKTEDIDNGLDICNFLQNNAFKCSKINFGYDQDVQFENTSTCALFSMYIRTTYTQNAYKIK